MALDEVRATGGDDRPPTVSVVTPLYNSSRHIAATLDTLLAQTYGDWECVLVDDGSTDATHEAVVPFLADPRFSYIRQPNQGIAAARNTGIRAARGTWIALLDHDDRWMSTKLERQLELARDRVVDVVATDAVIAKGGRREVYSECFPDGVRSRLLRIDAPDVDVLGLLLEANPLCAAAVMLRRDLFERHGLLEVAFSACDDYEMWLRCAPHARFGFVPEPLVEYVVHGANHSSDLVMLRERIIQVLFATMRRHQGDPLRLRQFRAALAVHHAALFKLLLDRGDVARAVGRAVALARRGPDGIRILAGATGLGRRLRGVRPGRSGRCCNH